MLKTTLALGSALLGAAWLQADTEDWRQIHAEISYVRAGTMATATDGHFEFKLELKLDQVLQRLSDDAGAEYPSYVTLNDREIVRKVVGSATLSAATKQVDETTGKTYVASASLKGDPAQADAFWLDSVEAAGAWGNGMMAKFEVRLPFQGSVSSSYPRVDDQSEEDAVLLWPTPIVHSADEGFSSEGEWFIRPVMVPKPDDEVWKMMHEMIESVNSLESMPGVGGFRPIGVGATTSGGKKDWVLTFKGAREFDTLVGGHYTETVLVTLREVPKTLPNPRPRPEAE